MKHGDPTPARPACAFLEGGGEMGARIRALDWSSHPLGDPAGWPHSLKLAVSICLGSRFPILIWWRAELFMLYNDAYGAILGRKHPAALGEPGREVWPEIWHIIRPMLEDTVLRDGEATWSNDQFLLVDRKGFMEETYFTFTYSPIRDESGQVGGVFCAVIETTERVVGERRLTLLKTLANRTSDLGNEEDVCARAMSVVEDASGDLAYAAVYLNDEDGEARLVACTAATPDRLPETLSRDAWSTTTLGAGVQILPIAAAGQSTPAGLFVAGLNPQRPYDAAYEDFLHLVAGQLAGAISNARAMEAERQRAESLAQLDRAKTAFFSNVSHEFRTPLTLMLGPLRDALSEPGRALDNDVLQSMNRNALRLLKLVNALLDFARIEAGRAEASYEAVDLSACTCELASSFRSAFEAAGLSFDLDCAPIPEPVYVDTAMWEKVVFNLLSNALKFTLTGGVSVRLSHDATHARLVVSDSGVGIADDQLPHIFERFHRVRVNAARTQEGAGIGLALVQELVRLHGGSVSAESEPGRGTSFTVSLPLGSAHLAPEAIGVTRSLPSTYITAESYVSEALGWVAPQVSEAPPLQPAEDRAAHIVLADDNADMREYVGRLLREHWRVEAVGDGIAALAAVRQRRPTLVVADVMMPGMDGFELLAAIRRDPDTASIPVVLLSARAGEEATLAAIAAGADDYLVKPFSARDLVARVDAQMTRASRREALRERMAQIDSVLNNAPIGVYLVDHEFRLAYVNPVAVPVFGNIPDLVGRDVDAVLHRLWEPEYADELVTIFRRVLDTGEPHVAAEAAEIRADRGVMEFYEWQVVRIQMPDGNYGAVCYFRDISSQVRARRQIAESERRYRALVTATSDAVYHMSADWSEMLRLEGQAFVADTLAPNPGWLDKYVHDDDHAIVRRAIAEAVRNRSTFELEHRIVRADGTLGWALSRAVPVLDGNGDIIEWFGTARDITSRRTSEAAVASLTAESERQRRLYRTILSTTPDLIYVFDLQHRFTYANDALLQMWGRSWEDAVGKTCLEVGYPPWHAEMHDREIEQVVATRQPIRGEVPFTGTGGRRIYDYIFVPVIGSNGEVEAIAGATRDVTERKEAEDAAHENEQRLADANRAKDEFLATLSHELRTPLNAVLGWAHMLRTGALRPELRERALESIERNAEAQAQLVDDLLDVSRIISGKLSIKTAPLELADAIATAVDAVRPAADAKNQTLDVHIEPDLDVIVSGDADRLRQVIWNLLSNAVKFTPDDGRIDAELHVEGAQAVISVRDNGAGIDPAFLPYVFERFQQADSTPSRRYGGLGLGLAIVRHLTEAHGGTVHAQSDGPGTGSTFTVRLPLHSALRRQAHTPDLHAALPQTIAGIRVLVTDDESDARELTRAALEARGAEVVSAASAGEALHAIGRQPFDLLIADIGLPEQDGYALIRAIRDLPEEHGGGLPAIALTAYVSLNDREQALSAGYDRHLGKPVDPEQLVAAVTSTLAIDQSRRSRRQ